MKSFRPVAAVSSGTSARSAASATPVTKATAIMAIVAVVATALLLAGCDYWHNLVGDKTVSHTSISVKIKDAWTGQPLAYSVCEDTARQVHGVADSSGQVRFSETPTGPYRLICSQEGYYPSELRFEAGVVEIDSISRLARRGGKDWYPLDTAKQIRALIIGNTHVPSNLVLRAFPDKTDGSLRYIWTFARHSELNRDSASIFAFQSELVPKLDSLAADTMYDTVTLKVLARLAGFPEYAVDSVQIPIIWVRNRKPVLEILGFPRTEAQVGCPDDKPFTIAYRASDPDGQCLSVQLMNSDTNTSLGALHIVQSCKAGRIEIPLDAPDLTRLIPGMDPQVSGINHLVLSARDDNNQTSDTELTFKTIPHALPTISIDKADSQLFYFSKARVMFRVIAGDDNSQLERLLIDWGDNNTLDYGFPASPPKGALDAEYPHTYAQPGNYFVHASIVNACGTKVTAALPGLNYIHIQADDTPKVAVTDPKYILKNTKPYFDFRLSVADKDLDSGQDSLAIAVSWGDGSLDSLYETHLAFSNKVIEHAYEVAPTDSVYHLRITVDDANGGSIDTTLQVAPYHKP